MPLPSVPNQIRVAPENESVIEDAKDQFFDAVLLYLGYADNSARASFAEVVVPEMIQRDRIGLARVTDDRLIMLIVQNVMVASVVIRRDEFNYCEASFALYLTPEIVSRTGRTAGRAGLSAVVRDDMRIDTAGCANPDHIHALTAAAIVAAALTVLVRAGKIDARSPVGDALLMWSGDMVMSLETAERILRRYGFGVQNLALRQ